MNASAAPSKRSLLSIKVVYSNYRYFSKDFKRVWGNPRISAHLLSWLYSVIAVEKASHGWIKFISELKQDCHTLELSWIYDIDGTIFHPNTS